MVRIIWVNLLPKQVCSGTNYPSKVDRVCRKVNKTNSRQGGTIFEQPGKALKKPPLF